MRIKLESWRIRALADIQEIIHLEKAGRGVWKYQVLLTSLGADWLLRSLMVPRSTCVFV